MRIYFVTPEFIDPNTKKLVDGGLASYLSKITRMLRDAGHSIGVVCYATEYFDEYEWNGVKVHFVSRKFKKNIWQRICWGLYSRNKRRYLKSGMEIARKRTRELLKRLNERNKIDIVQYASWLSTAKNALTNIPYCVRISSYAKLWQKNYGYSDKYEIEDEKIQFANAKFLYGPSRYIANFIGDDLNLQYPISIIETPFVPYSGETDNSLLAELNERIGDSEYLLFFGTIGLLKGAKEIADAVYRILSKYKKLSIVLIGKEALIDGVSSVNMIRDAAKEFSDRVLYFPAQPHSTLIPVIKGAKAILLPSRIDNLPNTCIESMGLGKVVIGSRGASFEQLIDDGVNGFLCEVKNPDSIVASVDKLMNMRRDKLMQMSNAAVERISKLSPSVILSQVLDYYKKVVDWRINK